MSGRWFWQIFGTFNCSQEHVQCAASKYRVFWYQFVRLESLFALRGINLDARSFLVFFYPLLPCAVLKFITMACSPFRINYDKLKLIKNGWYFCWILQLASLLSKSQGLNAFVMLLAILCRRQFGTNGFTLAGLTIYLTRLICRPLFATFRMSNRYAFCNRLLLKV